MYLSAFSRTTGVCVIIFLLGLVTNSATQHLLSSQATLLSETLLGHMSKVAEVHVLYNNFQCIRPLSFDLINSWIKYHVKCSTVSGALDYIMIETEGINIALVEDNKYVLPPSI